MKKSYLNSSVYEKSIEQINKENLLALLVVILISTWTYQNLNDTQTQSFGILHVDAHHDLREAYELLHTLTLLFFIML